MSVEKNGEKRISNDDDDDGFLYLLQVKLMVERCTIQRIGRYCMDVMSCPQRRDKSLCGIEE